MGEPAEVDPPGAFTCPVCGAVSHHADDVRYGYCGACHAFTGAPEAPAPFERGVAAVAWRAGWQAGHVAGYVAGAAFGATDAAAAARRRYVAGAGQ
jgi:hypothetical protein